MKDFQRSLLKTLVTIIILVLLGLYAYFGEFKKSHEEAAKKEEETKVVKGLKKEDIVELKIVHKDSKTIQLKKGEKDFRIVSPIDSDTDKNVIDTMLSTLETLKSTTRFIDNENLSSYGLTTPSLKIEYRLSNGNTRALLIGIRNDFDGKYYTKLEDSPEIFLIEGYVKGNLDKDLFGLRDKAVFKVETNEIKKIEFKVGENVYIFEQKDKKWQMLSPINVRADEEEISRIKNSIKNLTAKAFFEDRSSISEYGLDKTDYYLKIYKGADMSVSAVRLSKIKDSSSNERLFVMRQNTEVPIEVDISFYKDLDKTPYDYTFKKILDFDRDSVFSIEMVDGDNRYIFEKEQSDTGADWYYREGDLREKLKYYKVSSLLYFLSDTKATSMKPSNVITDKKYGLDKPEKIIIMRDSMAKEIDRVEFGLKDTEGVPLKSGVRDEISFIDTKKFEEVSFILNDYLDQPREESGSKSDE